jgi:hypothetical protein
MTGPHNSDSKVMQSSRLWASHGLYQQYWGAGRILFNKRQEIAVSVVPQRNRVEG